MALVSQFLVIAFLSWMLHCMAQGNVHYYDFVLKETNFTRLCRTKCMLTVNESFPGPVIRVHKGDTVFVNVQNHGGYGVTIHWHGVKQPRNPWSDGPEYITQCPIQPGTNFTYEVIFSKEEGTVWWHAHSDWTRSSVHGAIVVLPAEGTTYPFPMPDEEEILVIGNWFIGDVNKMVTDAIIAGGAPPRVNATVINGQPGDFYDCSNETTYHFLVDYGKTYLLRIVNAAMNDEFFFAIAEHIVTVVGIDGNYLKPITTPYVMISPGQTMDILLTANQSLGRYYMAARQLLTDGTSVGTNSTAILEYRGNYTRIGHPIYPSSLPSYVDSEASDRFFIRLRSLASQDHPVDVPQTISTHLYITVSINSIICPNSSCEGIGGTKLGASLNNISFQNPTTDVLLAYYRNISGIYTPDFPDQPPVYFDFTADDLVEDNTTIPMIGTKAKVLNYNETVEIVFQGTNVLGGSENHPMHLHGYSFYVVGSGHGNFNNETHPKSFNLVDPPELTTVGVPKNGWLAIRFRATNPGVWLWHCHLDRHLTWGMNTVLIVKNGGTLDTSIRDPPTSMPRCEVPIVTQLEEYDDSIENIDGLDKI
ncbi:hypothetical protein F0562_027424 [Nyssa sinensis]|uniref:Laccase n=1 Tax=Nyssa sinensis TaxID=561372 RepID=A0A5J5B6S3_9ASTE|nr:hypothetical protein F0562_027424 [Nyssa sinensis]